MDEPLNPQPAARQPAAEITGPAAVLARPVVRADDRPGPARPPRATSLAALSRREAGLDLLAVLVVLVLAPLAPSLWVWGMSDSPHVAQVDWSVALAKWGEALAAATMLVYLGARHRIAWSTFGIDGPGLGGQLGWALATVGAAYVYMLLTLAAASLLVGQRELEQDLSHRVEFVRALPLSDLKLSLALLVPVAVHEEIVFRGLLIPYLHRLTGHAVTAVLLSALLFGTLHIQQGVLGAVQITGLGIVLGGMFLASRSLPAIALAHFLFDFAQFQLARFVLPWLEQLGSQAPGMLCG